MHRIPKLEERIGFPRTPYKDIASSSRAGTGHRRNGAVAADSVQTGHGDFKKPATVVSLPVAPVSGRDDDNEATEASRSAMHENLEALAAATPEMRTESGSESLARIAPPATTESAVAVHAGDMEADPAVAGPSAESWKTLISDALREHRFAVALRPIEELACGSKLYEAMPRILDDAGNAMDVGDFYGPAKQLGLLKHIERKLVGYAFLAQLQLQHAGESAWMLVPLSASALDDQDLLTFLRQLAAQPGARLVMDSLVMEFSEQDITGRMKDMKQMSSELGKLGCNVGIRGFTATRPAEDMLNTLRFVTVRLAAEIVDRLADDEGLRWSLRAVSDRCAKAGTMQIAPGAPDANAMAMLYNLGVRAVEGPMNTAPRLYQPRRSNRLH